MEQLKTEVKENEQGVFFLVYFHAYSQTMLRLGLSTPAHPLPPPAATCSTACWLGLLQAATLRAGGEPVSRLHQPAQ